MRNRFVRAGAAAVLLLATCNFFAADAGNTPPPPSAPAAETPKAPDKHPVPQAQPQKDNANEKEIQAAVKQLAASDPVAVDSAKQKLKGFGASAAGALVDALEDEQPALQKNAAEVLKELGSAAKDKAWELSLLLDNDNKPARKLAASVLEKLGPQGIEVATQVADYLTNYEPSVRAMAANILHRMGPAAAPETASDLVDLLTHKDKGIRSLAMSVLVSWGAAVKECTEELANILANNPNDADARLKAATVLGAIGPDAKAALETLKKSKDDSDKLVKAAVEAAIQKIEK